MGQKINFILHNAFTLAEVLITLGIIGVVAALTVPVILKVTQDMEYKVAYRKAYADASNAFNSAKNQDLFVSPSAEGDSTNHLANFTQFKNQFATIKDCPYNSDASQCWDWTGEFEYSHTPQTDSPAFIDKQGRAWVMYYHGYFRVFVDTNGFKKPNQWGKDRFIFLVIDSNGGTGASGFPVKLAPLSDNNAQVRFGTNKCVTSNDYYGTSWLTQN